MLVILRPGLSGSWRVWGYNDLMADFDTFLKKLLVNPAERKVVVRGDEKKIKAMVRLTSKNYLGAEYIKILFEDGSFMLIIPGDKEIYFAEQILGRAPEISDEQIGTQEIIEYKGKKYKLGNKDDYQYVLQLLVGTPQDIEGECRFSDYFPVEGPKEFLSLGWLSSTGERADINPQIISLTELECR